MRLTAHDHVEIAQLYARYQLGIDGIRPVDDWLACWTKDGEHRFYLWAPNFPRGHAALRERADQIIAARPRPMYHWNTPALIEPAGFGATGQCYFLGVFEAEPAPAELGPALIYTTSSSSTTASGSSVAARSDPTGSTPTERSLTP
jgi:hypothetical protein